MNGIIVQFRVQWKKNWERLGSFVSHNWNSPSFAPELPPADPNICLPRMLVHTRCLLAPLKCDTVISMLFLFSSSMHSVPLILHMFLVISSVDRHFGHHFYPCFYCLSHPFPWNTKGLKIPDVASLIPSCSALQVMYHLQQMTRLRIGGLVKTPVFHCE